MVLRNIIKIDEEKCNGCGQCVNACAEGAIEIINGKAKLVSETYCDGLGDCIGHCPQDAITIEQRQADEFDEHAVKEHLAKKKAETPAASCFACPGAMAKKLQDKTDSDNVDSAAVPSQLTHWPVQMRLISPTAPYLQNADLLFVADCVPFAMGDFHSRLLRNHCVVVGCPKLDDCELYVEKLTEIVKRNSLNSLTVIHMEVPCCSGLMRIAKQAVADSNADLPIKDITISLQGEIKAVSIVEV